MEEGQRLSNISLALHKVCLWTFKYLPIISCLGMLVHCALLSVGVHILFIGTIFGTSVQGALTMTAASYAFKFCRLHRLMIWYNVAVTACINYQAAFGFGDLLDMHHYAMTIIGVLLFVALYIRRGI